MDLLSEIVGMIQETLLRMKGEKKLIFRVLKELPSYDQVSRISERAEFETPSLSPFPIMFQDDEISDAYGSNAMKGSIIVKNSFKRSSKINGRGVCSKCIIF
jgi:hypothetical protein